MASTNNAKAAATRPLTISRVFAAPRALVFQAWSGAEPLKRWFSPEGCSVPEAHVDFRPGGACVLRMRMPDGADHWMRGVYDEIAPPDRLAFTSEVTFADGRKFGARTLVTFEGAAGGTRMTVRQDYEIRDESLLFVVEGAREGWRTTLDKLKREVARAQGPGITARRAEFPN
jgi:uncharacterized protein YndB with AHSA1/START domain